MIGWTFICAWVRRYITLIYMGMAQLSLIRAYGSRAVLRLLGFFFFSFPLFDYAWRSERYHFFSSLFFFSEHVTILAL